MGRPELGDHAAGALAAAADSGQTENALIQRGDAVEQLGIGMGVGVGGVQTVDVRQENQKLGLDAFGHNGRQRVVVTDVIFCERKEWIGIEERSSA